MFDFVAGCRSIDVDRVFIDSGSPWQNAEMESSNGRHRDEFIDRWQFDNMLEVPHHRGLATSPVAFPRVFFKSHARSSAG